MKIERALTIHQPFASLIASGEKWIENRSQKTHIRGDFGVHAGKSTKWGSPSELKDLPVGAIVAVARLSGCISAAMLRSAKNAIESRDENAYEDLKSLIGDDVGPYTLRDLAMHKHMEGPWCWVVSDVRAIDPIPATGKQGWWRLGDDLAGRLEDNLRNSRPVDAVLQPS